MLGIDIGRLIDGATEVELLCTESDSGANPALRASLLYYLTDLKKKKKVHVLFHYSRSLAGFARWSIAASLPEESPSSSRKFARWRTATSIPSSTTASVNSSTHSPVACRWM